MAKKVKAKGPQPGQAVLVTTEHRGVFFGYFQSQENSTVTLSQCRNCVYWPATVKGFLGLAVTGPLDGSRVGPSVDEVTLYAVTAIVGVSKEAEARWEGSPWK